MLSDFSKIIYPRELSETEIFIIKKLLPQNKTGYQNYVNKLDDIFVIGNGRFGENNYFLGSENLQPDLEVPSSPVFAIGTVKFKETDVYSIIHEEFDEMIEIDFQSDIPIDKINIGNYISTDTLSEWLPGKNNFSENTSLREVHFKESNFVLAIECKQKKIWLYEDTTGMNHLISLTRFYSELMRIKNIKDPSIALKYELLFKDIDTFTNTELQKAFFIYNKMAKKVILNENDLVNSINTKNRKFFDRFIKRG